MSSLLEKTRKINRLLQRSENVEYDGISRVLSNVLNANVYITNKKGKIFGYAFVDDFECDLMVDKVINQGEFPKHYVNWLMRMDETNANLRSKTGMCAYSENSRCLFNGKTTKVNGNKQYTWGGPDAEVAYYQDTAGELDVSIKMDNAGSDFAIEGIGVIR